MAPELLGSINVRPAALEAAGYRFRDRDVRAVFAAAPATDPRSLTSSTSHSPATRRSVITRVVGRSRGSGSADPAAHGAAPPPGR